MPTILPFSVWIIVPQPTPQYGHWARMLLGTSFSGGDRPSSFFSVLAVTSSPGVGGFFCLGFFLSSQAAAASAPAATAPATNLRLVKPVGGGFSGGSRSNSRCFPP